MSAHDYWVDQAAAELEENGVPISRYAFVPPPDTVEGKAARLRADGLTYREIGELLGVHPRKARKLAGDTPLGFRPRRYGEGYTGPGARPKGHR